ncbi:MAG: SLBB domain-containing protein [Prevotella sp.]|nr:SLBB domain-containing protein [Prevotella sp.]
MKKSIILLLVLMLIPVGIMAQSSMTDDQVFKYVIKEHENGTSQSQIVTQLMQRGVDITQIRRVRKKFERMSKDQALGVLSNDTERENGTGTDSRQRRNNGESRYDNFRDDRERGEERSSYRVREGVPTQRMYNEDDEEWAEFRDELNEFLPADTATMYLQLLAKMEKDKKKVFGRDIFNKRNLSFEPSMSIATPANYRLGPGDAVFIDIYGASQKTIEGTVSPDGTVTIEGFGPVHVSGLTVEQANAQLRSQLGKRYQSSQIRLTVGQTRTIMVNVFGEVKAPGTYTLSAFASVFHALYMAGGPSELGTLRNIKVYRNNQLVTTVDVYDYILNGQLTGNVRLADNDVIMVGTYDCLVNISGKVKRPMFYEMRKNESLSTLLRYAGGFTGDAYKSSVRVVRKTGRQFSVYNVGEFDMSTFTMNDEDSVSVDSIIQRFENMVEIKGAVFRPGMYQVGGDITSVLSLIQNSEGLTEDAFTDHAVLHRMRPDRTLEVVQVDVQGILDGRVADMPLKPNDVLFIPTKQDLQEEQTLTIHGEVHYPGIYKFAYNETIEDFILQAGGLKDGASTAKIDVSRRILNPGATANDSIVAQTYSFALKDGFIIDGEVGFTLQPFDEVYVRKSPGSHTQQNITIDGEVLFAGTYTIDKKTMRLSDAIKAAGGVNDLAYVRGARLERRTNETERLRMEAIQKKEREQFETNMMESMMKSGNAAAIQQMQDQQTGAKTQQMRKYEVPATYPVGIELDKALANPGGREDVVLREGDRIIVPRYDATVKINGEVMYPNTVAYRKGKSASWYIDQAGGFTSKGKKSQTYIIYMNGTVAKAGHNAKPEPGCEIVVPAKPLNKTTLTETLSIATGIGSLAAIIATLASLLK